MNYSRIYQELCTKAKLRSKPIGRIEAHHIIPRSHGGTDGKENLVLLTIREHIFAHHLLIKIFPKCYKMACAFKMMTSRKGQRITSSMASDAKEAVLATMARGYHNATLYQNKIYIVNAHKSSASHVFEESFKGLQFATTMSYQGKCMDDSVCIRAYVDNPNIFYGAEYNGFIVRQLYSYDGSVRVCGWKNGKDTNMSLKNLLKSMYNTI